jgi:hypothetical protein
MELAQDRAKWWTSVLYVLNFRTQLAKCSLVSQVLVLCYVRGVIFKTLPDPLCTLKV